MKKKVLIVGLGSIGLRHQKILKDRGSEVFVVSRSQSGDAKSLSEFFKTKTCDIVVICTESSLHYQNLTELSDAGFTGEVIVEKPLFSKYCHHTLSETNSIFVAFNQRFNSGLQKIFQLIKNEEIIQAQAYVGQHLSTWRSNRPYTKSYSSDKSLGGGVLRDLSHELDYCLWLFGGVRKIYALGGKFSDLQINSDDSQAILLAQEKCPMVQITLNYLDRETKRILNIVTNKNTYHFNFLTNEIKINGQISPYIPQDPYQKQWDAILKNDGKEFLCTYTEALQVSKLIDDIEEFQNKEVK